MRPALAAILAFLAAAPAFAITGKAPPATGWPARPIVMLTDKNGDLCTATALAPDLVLTAAHCVTRRIDYTVEAYQTGTRIPTRTVVVHPHYDAAAYAASRATADVALVKLAAPLPAIVQPALLAPRRVTAGETLTIAGFGVTLAGTARGLGIPRMAELTVTGKPGALQIRLVDRETRNVAAGRGGCTGDSGAPAFSGEGPQGAGEIVGIVSWSTAPRNETGCGGLTGLTPLVLYRDWIVETAAKLNSPLGP